METAEVRDPILLHLASLMEGMPALTAALGGALAEAATVCLVHQGDGESCSLQVQWQARQRVFTLHRLPMTETLRRAYLDLQEATELGACGVAILAARKLTGYTVVERSVKGTGFDYWLGAVNPPDSELEPLERKARLEVSGILQGATEGVEARIREKIRQTRCSAGAYPAYIVVVKFDMPGAWMERDE